MNVQIDERADYIDRVETNTGTGTGTGATVYQSKIQRAAIADEFYMLLRDREDGTFWVRNLRTNEEAYSQDNTQYTTENQLWANRLTLTYSVRSIGRR